MSAPADPALTIAPAFDREAACVVLATDARYVPFTAVTIRSIIEAASPDKYYDLVILETAVPEADRLAIKALAGHSTHISLRFFDVTAAVADRLDRLFISAHMSPVTYYRLFAPTIFPRFAKMLYLDVDLIALADIAGLYETDLGDHLAGGVRDFYAVKDLLAAPDSAWARQLGLADVTGYFNAGVTLFNLDQMRAEGFEQKWFDYLQRVQKPRLHDQDILNHCCQGRVKFLDAGWNCQVWSEEINGPLEPGDLPDVFLRDYAASKKEPKIIHYLSRQKPWHLPQLPSAEIFWSFAARTPYHARLVYDNLKMLNFETRAWQNKFKFPPLIAKYWFYRLMSLIGPAGRRIYYRDKGKKIQARREHGW